MWSCGCEDSRGRCTERWCQGREEPPATGCPSAPLGLGAAESRDPQLHHRPKPAGQPLSRKPLEPAGLIGCLKAARCTKGPAAWGLQGHPSRCQRQKQREAVALHPPGQWRGKEEGRRERLLPKLDTLLWGTLSLRASSSNCHCGTVCFLVRERDIQTYANTHRNTFPYCKMRILNLQASIETVYRSFVVTCLPMRISWSLTDCLASPVPTAIPGSRLSSSDLA